jgi:hypothetical protein
MDNKSGSVLSDPAQHPVELKQIDIFFVWVNFRGEHPSAHIGFFAAKLCFGLHTAWVASRVEYGVQVPRFLLPVSIFFFPTCAWTRFSLSGRRKSRGHTTNSSATTNRLRARKQSQRGKNKAKETNRSPAPASLLDNISEN